LDEQLTDGRPERDAPDAARGRLGGAAQRRGGRLRRRRRVHSDAGRPNDGGGVRQRVPGKAREAREDALLGLALEVADAADGSVVLADGLVQHDARPVARRELRVADVRDLARLRPADPHAVADDEAVGIFRQDDTGV